MILDKFSIRRITRKIITMIIWEAWVRLQECHTCIQQAWTCCVAVEAACSSEVNPFFFFFKNFQFGLKWAETAPNPSYSGRYNCFFFKAIKKKKGKMHRLTLVFSFPFLFPFHVLFVYFLKKFPNNLVIISI